jgi:hypothetical protein
MKSPPAFRWRFFQLGSKTANRRDSDALVISLVTDQKRDDIDSPVPPNNAFVWHAEFVNGLLALSLR